jgi:hypothetical protein
LLLSGNEPLFSGEMLSENVSCNWFWIFSHVSGTAFKAEEMGTFSLVSTIEELLERKGSGSCPENRDYGRRNPSR